MIPGFALNKSPNLSDVQVSASDFNKDGMLNLIKAIGIVLFRFLTRRKFKGSTE